MSIGIGLFVSGGALNAAVGSLHRPTQERPSPRPPLVLFSGSGRYVMETAFTSSRSLSL